MKKRIQINKADFLDWRFEDEDDLIYLGSIALDMLKGLDELDIDSIWMETGYLPARLIVSGLDIDNDEGDEISPQDYEVDWL